MIRVIRVIRVLLLKPQCYVAHHRESSHGDEADLIVTVIVRMTTTLVDGRIYPAAGSIVLVEEVRDV